MIRKITTTNIVLKMIFVFLLFSLQINAQPYKILNNGQRRIGNGVENSINSSGNMQQPFYYNSSLSTWRQLTFSTYPLDIRWGVGGNGTNNWNINGDMQDNPIVSNPVYDYSGFTTTNAVTGDGYGVIKFSGNITINSQLFLLENTYTLLQPDGFFRIKVKITNLSGISASNVRLWVGTRDDWVGGSDGPTKERGNLVAGVFTLIPTVATQAKAIKVSSGTEAILFFSNSPRAYSTINNCCSFINATNQDPATNSITQTGDGSYATYVRFNDLLAGQSDELDWYYASGTLTEIADIILKVAEAAGAVSNVSYTSADYSYSASQTGTTSYLLVPAGSTVPTDVQIEAGVNYPGGTVISSSSIPSVANVAHIYNFTGLTYNSNYSIYAVTKFFNGVSNVFTSVQTTNFATLPNDLPVGSAIANQTTCINGSLSGISLTITDAYPGDNTFTVTGSSSNTSLVPNGNIVITGTGSSRSIAITPSVGISGTSTITISMTDSLGAIGTRTFNVTFNDIVTPTITAPAAVNTTTNTACTATGVALGTPVTADNCGVASVTNNAPTAFPRGVTTVTWTVTDLGGNTATATQTVTITDNVNPTITAPATVNTTTNTACTATGLALGTPTTADNCSVASVTNNAPTVFPLGATTVTWTVTDGSGRTATATQTVNVTDNVNPTITAPAAVNTTTNTACTATGVALGTPTNADNCSVASVTNNAPTAFPLGATTVTWTVTDGAGNTATATQIVTVTDNVNPTITAPVTVNATTNTACTATSVVLGTPVTADNCSVASVTNNHASTTYPLGATTVTWTVTDGSGRTATATQTVTVTDNVNPTITAPANINTTTNTACTATGVALGTPVTADNCSVASVTNNAPTAFPLGDTTVIWTVTDGAGRTATATQLVTVTDIVNPTITAPAEVNTTTNTACTATGVTLGTPITADNCSVASVTNNAPTAFLLGANTVTWTVTDSAGNIATATQTVTVTDNVNPTITAPTAVNVTTNTACTATGVALGTPTTADNCSVASVTNNHPSTTYPLGATTVTWTVTDGSGRTATATQLVTVTDNVNPTITAPADVAGNVNSSCVATTVVLGNPVTADNCSVASVTNNAPATFPYGDTTVTWTVTDGSGNTATATQLVSVGDVIYPVVKTKNATVYLNNLGQAIVTPAMIDNGTTDNCAFSLIVSPNNFVCGNVGINNVILIATDASGNQTIRPAFVTVVDNTPPAITASSAVSAIANASCGATGVALGTPVTTDNCFIDTPAVNNAPSTFPLGATTVTWTVTDRSGNSATATQIVTVLDTQNPTIATLAATSVNADAGVCTYASSQLTKPTAADNCSVASVVAFPASLALGSNSVTWTATDGSGLTTTSTQTVTVVDDQKPTVIAPSNVTVSANVSCNATGVDLGIPTTTDNCSVASTSNDAPATFPLGDTTVTWTVTDGSGNTATATQTVTVVDNQKPTIATLDPISVNADTGVCTYASSQLTAPTAADNCSVATVVASPTSLILGSNIVTWTATDGSGNTETSTQTVTVVDSQNPTIVTLDAINVNADSGVCTYASSQLTAPTAADNCSVATVVASPASLDLGENTVTWTVTDGSGLTETSTQTVTVIDAQNPTIATLDPISVNADAGFCSYDSSQLTKPSALDNCSVATVVASPISLDAGSNLVTWTVTDGSGNTETSTQTVTVIDNQKPTIETLTDISVNADASVCTYDSSQLTKPSALDNCSVATVVASPISLDAGSNLVTWTATDGSGNTETSTQTVTVVDTQNPTIATLDAISVNADSGVCTYASSQLTAPTAADNCSVATVTVSPETLDLGDNTVTWTVTDGTGLSATSTQTITVVDTQKPTIVTLDPISVNADADVCTYASSQLTAPAALDNCSVATIVASPESLILGENTVTWTVTDGSGNTETSIQTVTIIDTQKPTLVTLDPISVNADSGICSYASSQLTSPTAADNCNVATIVASPASLDLGENTVTWTVTDGSGLTETSVQIVTVVDAQIPTIATLDPISVNADSGVCTYESSQLTAPTAADNCSVATVAASPATLVSGANTVTWTVTDGAGLTATSTQTVTVLDSQNPTIATVDVVVSSNASCNATGVDLGTPVTTDNCLVALVTNNAPATFPLGDTAVTWTVTDGSGNTATATQTVTVEDTILPTITAPAAVNGNVNASCGASGVVLGNAITADNCSVASVTNDAPAIFTLGETTVIWTVTDGSGNIATATQLVTMGDTISPVVKTKNATVYLNSVGQAIILPSMIDNGTTDNCAFTLTVSPNNLVCANVGINNVLLIATDASGNQSFKPATVTLVDNLAPSITAPSNVSASANASCSATGIVLGFPVITDNCYIDAPAVNNAPATFPIGVTTVTWTVTDRNGNSATANQTVTVTDAVLPIVKTKDITIQLDASGNATITAADIDNGSSDNCGISTMTLSQDTFTISDTGIQTITLTVTDNSGNTSSATAQVTVGGTLNTAILKSSTFLIYPMPFDSHINITLPDSYTEEVIYIQVYDLSGRAVYNQKHAVENHNVTVGDLKAFSDGSYYINVLNSNQTVILSKHILKKTKQ